MSILHSLDARRIVRSLRLAGVVVLALFVHAVQADDNAEQRARIARERAVVEREAQAGEAACARQFALTACVERVHGERRVALDRLARQQALLDDEQRKRRAAERLERLQLKREQAATESATTAASAGPPTRVKPAQLAPATPARDTAAADARANARLEGSRRNESDAAARAAAAASRASEAQAHRDAVERRNALWRKTHKASQPLPTPKAADRAASGAR